MSLEELNQKLQRQNLIGHWTIPNTSTGFREPEPAIEAMGLIREETRD